jgi:hypothetical protein
MQTTSIPENGTEQKVILSITIWGLLSFFMGYFKTFNQLPRPFFGLCVMLILTTLIVLYFKNTSFQRISNAIPLKSIALFHSWRIFAGWIFLSFSDRLPETFINNAAYGDIVAGCLGLGVLIVGQTKLNYYIFNVLGLIDFFLAVGTGLYLTVIHDPKMESITHLPLIMIPLFGVPISGYTHFISLYRLGKIKTQKITDFVTD